MEKHIIFWVDAVKAICMIVVYFAHAEIYTHYTILPINNVFRPFYVNAFFFVSGYLLFRKQWSGSMLSQSVKTWLDSTGGGGLLIKNVLFKLAIPSVIFAFINFFPKKIVRGEEIEVKELLADTIGGCSLWFTCSLVLVELFVFLMLLTRSNKTWGYLLTSMFVAIMGLFLINKDISLLGMTDFPWFYKRAMLALLYVVCGGCYFKYEEQIVGIMRRWYVLALLVTFYFVVEFLMPEKAQCLTSLGEMNVLGACVSIVGSVLLIELCRKLKENVVLTFVAKNSIVFYFFSGALPVMLSVILSRFMEVQNVAGMMIVFILSLLIGSVAAFAISRWFPWLLDVRNVCKR